MLRGMTDGLKMRWGIDANPIGTLDEDEVAHQAARWRRPIVVDDVSEFGDLSRIERIGSHLLTLMGQRAGVLMTTFRKNCYQVLGR